MSSIGVVNSTCKLKMRIVSCFRLYLDSARNLHILAYCVNVQIEGILFKLIINFNKNNNLMDKKSFYRILILVIFAAVVGGGILAWQYYWGPSEKQNPLPTLIIPTSIKTTNWKTYSNPEAKFTFKYPENWEVKADYYYQTSAGVKAVKPTIVLGPK